MRPAGEEGRPAGEGGRPAVEERPEGERTSDTDKDTERKDLDPGSTNFQLRHTDFTKDSLQAAKKSWGPCGNIRDSRCSKPFRLFNEWLCEVALDPPNPVWNNIFLLCTIMYTNPWNLCYEHAQRLGRYLQLKPTLDFPQLLRCFFTLSDHRSPVDFRQLMERVEKEWFVEGMIGGDEEMRKRRDKETGNEKTRYQTT